MEDKEIEKKVKELIKPLEELAKALAEKNYATFKIRCQTSQFVWNVGEIRDDYDRWLINQIRNYTNQQIRKSILAMGVEIAKCKKCGKEIIWLKSKYGKSISATLELINHFADCPNAQEFRKTQ